MGLNSSSLGRAGSSSRNYDSGYPPPATQDNTVPNRGAAARASSQLPARAGTGSRTGRLSAVFSGRPLASPQFQQTLRTWAAQAGSAQEEAGRREAVTRIVAAQSTGAKELDLAELGLTALPACLHELGSVKELVLNDNNLTTLTALPGNLRTLEANNNALIALPALPGSLTTLEAYGNALTELPPLPLRLRELDVARNALTLATGPDGAAIVLPPDLRDLDVRWNPVEKFPLLPNSLSSMAISLEAVAESVPMMTMFAAMDWIVDETMNNDFLTMERHHLDTIRDYQQWERS